MKNSLTVTFFLIIIGAGVAVSEYSERVMLLQYYKDYKCIVQNVLGQEVRDVPNISIRFAKLEKNQIGSAKGLFEPQIIDIQISKKWWNKMTDNERRVFMYHELSHDVHGQKHCIRRDCIMYPNKAYMKITDADEMLELSVITHEFHPRQVIRFNPFK